MRCNKRRSRSVRSGLQFVPEAVKVKGEVGRPQEEGVVEGVWSHEQTEIAVGGNSSMTREGGSKWNYSTVWQD